jgi:hypothetical protein
MNSIITEAALPPIITCIFSVMLGTYIYVLDHEHSSNKIFIIFMNAIALLTFLDFSQAISSNENIALSIAKIKYAYLLIIPTLFVHLSYYLSDNKKIIKSLKYIYILYLISVIFFIISISTNLIVRGVTLESGIYSTDDSLFQYILLLFAIIYLVIGFAFLIITFKSTINNNKRIQLKYIFYGMAITTILFFSVSQLIPIFVGFEFEGSLLFTLPMFISYAYAILKYKLMSEVELVTEDIPFTPIDYDIEPGFTYIIPEAMPKVGFQLFAKTVKSGAHGICITMNDPSGIRDKYGLRKTPIIWITKDEPHENQNTNDILVKPKEIATIGEILNPFLNKSQESVILLIDDKAITSGITLRDHKKILDLSKSFFDTVVTANSSFIISVSPKSISQERKMPIIKTRTPLLEFNRLSALVFEEITNDIVRFLIRNGYLKPEKVHVHLANLRKNDIFFKNINYRRSVNSTSSSDGIRISSFIEVRKLSKQIMIDKLKLFITEFEKIETAIDMNSLVQKAINKYGLSKSEFQLHYGDTYLIPQPDTRRSYEIFVEFVSKDYKGLCITKSNPQKINRKYSMENKGVRLFWLTDISSKKDYVLPPKLEHILSAIEDFIKSTHEKKIIILDGIEYLIFYSGDIFDAVLGFLRRLTDRVSETNTLVLIPVDPKALSEQRISLLNRSGIEIYNPE